MRQQYAWRSMFLNAMLAFMAVVILLQMVRIQVSAEANGIPGLGTEGEYRKYFPERGEIYDRNGHLLAGNRTVYEVGVDLNTVRDPHTVALTLSVNLGKDYDEIYTSILNPPPEISYLVIEKSVSVETAEYLMELKQQVAEETEGLTPSLAGLGFTARLERNYPEGALASNVIGFFNQEEHGNFGVEQKYHDLLAGISEWVWVPSDPTRAVEIPRVPNGTNLILTINRDLQAEVEYILDQALYEYAAHNGTIVVMNPKTGEILAMATTPRMDLNQYWNYGEIYNNGSEYNRAISMPYEPGSVIKIFPMAAAFDTGKVDLSTTFLDTGGYSIAGTTIQNWDKQAWGVQDMLGCIQNSLNVCLAWVAAQLGAQDFYAYMERFGFGRLTGVDLAGEAAGRLKIPGDPDWYPIDLGTNSYGQGMTATPLQVMMAASAIANNGRMVTPRILHAMVRDGNQFNVPPQYAGMPISAQTAAIMNELLAQSLENQPSEALVPGYRVAGKTGTASIPTDFGFYDLSQTNASFIGWGPVDDPQFMVYVWLERPGTSIWGSQTAAPVFARVVERTVVLLDIPPDHIRKQVKE
ncbi:MAG: penicillin-binding protein 2 [Anaerolineales bacterium]